MEKISIKNQATIDLMRHAGNILATILEDIRPSVVPGVSTFELDALVEAQMVANDLKAVCKGYGTYKFATCISLNDTIVHGIPSKEIILKSGDFVKIDVVGAYKGYCADLTRYYFVGEVSASVQRIAAVAQQALDSAIAIIRPGIRLSDVSSLIQQIVEKEGFGVVREFAGHGIGQHIHEAPTIENYGPAGRGPLLLEGMTLAIEPMITEKSFKVRVMPDGWTAKTVDGGLSAHVEDTVAVTKDGAAILTRVV
jgi:methionyl aminopeptidase